jgi:hypothetical protein
MRSVRQTEEGIVLVPSRRFARRSRHSRLLVTSRPLPRRAAHGTPSARGGRKDVAVQESSYSNLPKIEKNFYGTDT